MRRWTCTPVVGGFTKRIASSAPAHRICSPTTNSTAAPSHRLSLFFKKQVCRSAALDCLRNESEKCSSSGHRRQFRHRTWDREDLDRQRRARRHHRVRSEKTGGGRQG